MKRLIDLIYWFIDLRIFHVPFHLKHWKWLRLTILGATDMLMVGLSLYLSYAVRLDNFGLANFYHTFLETLPVYLTAGLVSFAFLGMYRQVWRYANYNSAILIILCCFATMSISLVVCQFMDLTPPPPRSIPIIFLLLSSGLVGLTKFSWRAIASLQSKARASDRAPCFVYGAGSSGELLVRHYAHNTSFPFKPVGFIDDDRNLKGRSLHGLRVLGTGQDLERLSQIYTTEHILIAIHSAPGKVIRNIVTRCQKAGFTPLIMPDVNNSIQTGVFQPRPVNIKDLLRRVVKDTDHVAVREVIHNKTILITGGGGSIGSELCRQVIQAGPAKLVYLDSSEYNLYTVNEELTRIDQQATALCPKLGSVTDRISMERLFREHRPHVVLHAAAYKHVPMLESNPLEGIRNNIEGTKLVAELSVEYGVERFVLISTDKAVRPANVMGATKRVCELVIHAMNEFHKGSTKFSMVRFGNVLGSSGSVIPKFMEQIKNGGPVTVTHPEVTRYFMLISEAVALVLQSMAIADGGETFVLNMGDSVKIYDMAAQLIRLAGKEPGRDIEIIFTGLRPGEKLYEELILDGSEKHTEHDDVFIATPENIDANEIIRQVSLVHEAAMKGDTHLALEILFELSQHKSQGTSLFARQNPHAQPSPLQ